MVLFIVIWRPPVFGYIYTLGGVYSSYSYAMMDVGMGGFEFCLDVGDGVFILLGSFTIRYAIVLGGLLCLNSTLVFGYILVGDLM